ncbi:MAG: energy transducer TonB [Rikenellaceae bacterium]
MDYSAFKEQSGIEKSDLLAGWIAVAVYLVLLILLVCFVTFDADDKFEKKELSSGILINFGNDSPGHGAVVTRDESAAETQPQETKVAEAEPVVNDHAEKAVVKAVPEKPKVKEKPKPKKTEPKKPVVNSGALYKKKTGKNNTSENSASHGSTEGRTGKSGSEGGELGAPGGGGNGANFSLTGRKLMEKSMPDYEERIDGQIVMEIQVDRGGKVTGATFLPKNSTISSRKVIEAVRQAAMKTKFNADQKAAFTQVGTITYILKVE